MPLKIRKSILRGLGKRTRALNVLFTAEHGLDKLGVVIELWRDISREMILEHGDGCLRRVKNTYAAFYIYSAFSYFAKRIYIYIDSRKGYAPANADTQPGEGGGARDLLHK